METRANPGIVTLANHEAVIDVVRLAGFSLIAAAHAYAVLDAFAYGFAVQVSMLTTAGLNDSAAPVAEGMNLTRFPRLAELAMLFVDLSVHEFGASFDVVLVP